MIRTEEGRRLRRCRRRNAITIEGVEVLVNGVVRCEEKVTIGGLLSITKAKVAACDLFPLCPR